ncbi:T9SS type A sorting domain-containing protein [Moheibacter sp.]|uniref:T9SS type A sorting domain-containing protein n=1 Tax=Moheibacter sp. TaxID=1965316 RepID=UPI003C7072BB
MKKILFSLALVAGFSLVNAQTVLIEDDFESYEDFIIDGVGDWVLIDVDGLGTYSGGGGTFPNQFDPKAFMVFNPLTAGVTNDDGSGGETRNFDPHSGDKYMGAWASSGGANNDWLISPPITLGAADNVVEFYAKSMSDSYGLEMFNTYVYVGSDVPSTDDFVWIDQYQPGWENWELVSENLDAYAGQTIRYAIQCVSNDVYMLMIDTFKVTTGGLGISDLNANVSSVYPNPVVDTFNVSLSSKFNTSNVTVTVTDLAGRTVKTFGAADSYNVSDLSKGVYVVTITDGKNTETKKIVKK